MCNTTKRFYLFISSVLIIGCFSPLFGQIGIQSVGVNFGWYKPSLKYWNENSQISNWNAKFNGSFLGNVNIVANVYKPLRMKFELGYWRESVKQSNTFIGIDKGTEEISLNLIPVSATLLFDLPIKNLNEFSPYVGVGGSSFIIRKTYISSPNHGSFVFETASGYDYSGHIVLGVETAVAQGLSLGLELRYVMGSYIQLVENSSGAISEQSVSISGPQINFTWIYLIKN